MNPETLRATRSFRDLWTLDPSVTFLNHGPRVQAKPLAAKFADWQAAAPPAHRAFIARLGAVFGW